MKSAAEAAGLVRRSETEVIEQETAMYEIVVEKVFAASHAIRLPDGSLEPLHGHNWPVQVRVASDDLDQIETVMDFHDLEKAIDPLIRRAHNAHLNDIAPFRGDDGSLAVNPSAERVAWWIGATVAKSLPAHVRLVSVSVGEAPGCTAIYRP